MTCRICDDVGWYVDHDPRVPHDGGCSCGGIQVLCDCPAGDALISDIDPEDDDGSLPF